MTTTMTYNKEISLKTALTWANCQKDKCVYKCQNKEDTYQDQSVEFDLVIRSCQRNVIRHFGSSYCYNDKGSLPLTLIFASFQRTVSFE